MFINDKSCLQNGKIVLPKRVYKNIFIKIEIKI